MVFLNEHCISHPISLLLAREAKSEVPSVPYNIDFLKSPPLNSNDLQTNYFSAHSERYHPDGKSKDGDPPPDCEQRKHLQSTSTTEDRPDQLESHWQDLEETGDEGRQKLALGRAKQRRRSDFP